MDCKKLKISIVQYMKRADARVCKLTIVIDNDKFISEIEITKNTYWIAEKYVINKITELQLKDKLTTVLQRARYQMQEDRKFGIDTYWKWSAKL